MLAFCQSIAARSYKISHIQSASSIEHKKERLKEGIKFSAHFSERKSAQNSTQMSERTPKKRAHGRSEQKAGLSCGFKGDIVESC